MYEMARGSAGDISSKFWRAAEQRLAIAEFLMRHGYHLDSMYLSGYCVECALKALILRRTPEKRLADVRAGFRGQKAHNFDHLKERLSMVNCFVPAAESRHLRTIASWSPQLRYEDGRRSRAEAERFVIASGAIRDWVKGRL